MNWIIIAVIVILVIVLFKMKEIRHKFGAMAVIVLILFFLLTFSQVAFQPGVDFKSFGGVMSAAKIYFSWLGQVFGNIKTITGNVINLDWGFGLNQTK